MRTTQQCRSCKSMTLLATALGAGLMAGQVARWLSASDGVILCAALGGFVAGIILRYRNLRKEW